MKSKNPSQQRISKWYRLACAWGLALALLWLPFSVKIIAHLPALSAANPTGLTLRLPLGPGLALAQTPDLTVTKSAPLTVEVGSLLTYTLTVTNNAGRTLGSGDEVLVFDNPPSGTTVDCSSTPEPPNNWSLACDSGYASWHLDGSFLDNTSVVFTFAVAVSPSLPGGSKIVNNDYGVSLQFQTPITGPYVTTTVYALPVSLSIGKTDNPDPVRVGDLLTYTLTINNNSALGPAENVVVTETLPASVTYITAGFLGSVGGSIDRVGNIVTWNFTTTIPAGTSAQVWVRGQVNPLLLLPNPPLITNTTYSAAASNADPVTGPPVATQLQAGAVYAINLVVNPSTIANLCETTVATATVVDTAGNPIPNTSVNITEFGGSDHISPTLASGFTNSAGVFAATFQGIQEPIPPNPIIMAASIGGLLSNGVLLTINSGTPVPTSLSLTAAPNPLAAGGATAIVTGTLTYCRSDLAFDKTITFTVSDTGLATLSPPTAVTNFGGQAVTTLTSSPDPVSGTLTLTAAGEGLTQSILFSVHTPVLTVTKTANPTSQVNPGGPISYILTVDNIGDVEAANVRLTDTLPLSVNYVSVISSTTGNGVISGLTVAPPEVALSISKLEVGRALNATIGVTVTATTSGTVLSNVAHAGSQGSVVIASNIVMHTVISATTTGGNVYLPIILRNSP